MKEDCWPSQAKRYEPSRWGQQGKARVEVAGGGATFSTRAVGPSGRQVTPKAEGLCRYANMGQADEPIIPPGPHSGPFSEENS